jgi:hypothetical protein
MRGGVAYYPSEIYEAIGIKPFAAPPIVRAASPDPRMGSEEQMGDFSFSQDGEEAE